MSNEILPPNSAFNRAMAQVQKKRRTEETDGASAARRSSPRARLNFIPDDSLLAEMIDRAMHAMANGARWARGAILNLLV